MSNETLLDVDALKKTALGETSTVGVSRRGKIPVDATSLCEWLPKHLPRRVRLSCRKSSTESSEQERELVAAILRKDRKATARFVAEYTDCVYG